MVPSGQKQPDTQCKEKQGLGVPPYRDSQESLQTGPQSLYTFPSAHDGAGREAIQIHVYIIQFSDIIHYLFST